MSILGVHPVLLAQSKSRLRYLGVTNLLISILFLHNYQITYWRSIEIESSKSATPKYLNRDFECAGSPDESQGLARPSHLKSENGRMPHTELG